MNDKQEKESLYTKHVWQYTCSTKHGRHRIIELLYAFFYPFYAIAKYASNIGAIGFGLWIITFILLKTKFDSPASYRFGAFITNYGLLAVLALMFFGFPLRWVFSHITRRLLRKGIRNAQRAIEAEIAIYLKREERFNAELAQCNGKYQIEKRWALTSYMAYRVYPDGRTEPICQVESPMDRERYKIYLEHKKEMARQRAEREEYLSNSAEVYNHAEASLDEYIRLSMDAWASGYDSPSDYISGINRHDDY